MIGNLARKRTNLAALAVLAALIGAMLVALPPARAQTAPECVANPDITLGIGEACTIEVAKVNEDAIVANSDDNSIARAVFDAGTVTITGVTIGEADVFVGNFGTDTAYDNNENSHVLHETFAVRVLGFAIKSLTVSGDSDNTVKAGAQVTVTATLRSALTDNGNSAVRLTVPTTGLSIQAVNDSGDPIDGTTQQQTKGAAAAGGTQTLTFLVNTAGAPNGEYTLTFTASADSDFATTPTATGDGTVASAQRNQQVTQTLTLIVGDPGAGLASATLSLGNASPDLPYTDNDETTPETGTQPASDGDIKLVIEAFDSLGGKANSGAINQIIVIAPGGSITSTHNTGAGTDEVPITASGSSSATLNEVDVATGDPAVGDVGQKTVITVAKSNGQPGTVTVHAIVSGPGGAATTETVTLTFSGPPTSLSVADSTESLLSVNVDGDDAGSEPDTDTIKLLVTAEDASGNNTEPPTSGVSIVITDPDGKRQGQGVIERAGPDLDAGKYYITLGGTGSGASPLKAGTWTVTVTSGKLSDTATFTVAGGAADVAVTASATSSNTIGDVITVTATVSDKDGNEVSDGTSVRFDVSTNTGLAAIGTGHSGKATKDGSASVKYAVVGEGHSVISATAGGATGVIVIDSTAGGADSEAMMAGTECLTNLAAFTSWQCAEGVNVSEIFAELSGRGATAIHLWNTTRWVRYAVVDGVEIVGSNDFLIKQGDTLYISN